MHATMCEWKVPRVAPTLFSFISSFEHTLFVQANSVGENNQTNWWNEQGEFWLSIIPLGLSSFTSSSPQKNESFTFEPFNVRS